jgi:hypothetical protein
VGCAAVGWFARGYQNKPEQPGDHLGREAVQNYCAVSAEGKTAIDMCAYLLD